MAAWPALARAVAAHGLPGTPGALVETPAEPKVWAHLLSCATHERITGLLAAAIADGALPVTDEQAGAVDRVHRSAMATAVKLERTLLGTTHQLEEAGIDSRVLKGSAVAHLDYPDPALRSFGDIDLLIRSDQFDDAIALLVSTGHRRRYPEPRPGFDRRFGKGSCLVAPNGHELDLHRTLAMGPFGMGVRLGDLWAQAATFHLAGSAIAALGAEERFLHACFHATLGGRFPRLATLRDVAQMQLVTPVDTARALELSGGWGADAVVAAAVNAAWEALELPSSTLAQWAAAYEPTRRERHGLAVYTGQGSSYAAKSFAAIRAIPRRRDQVAYLFSLAFPRRRYLQQRGEGSWRRWQRGARQIVRGARRH